MTNCGLAGLLLRVSTGYTSITSRPLRPRSRKRFNSSFSSVVCSAQQTSEQLLVVVGGGAAGIYASIKAKEVAPHLSVLVIEKAKLLSKVKISGGGRCNVTNGNFLDKIVLSENYPRGNKELRGSFFDVHGPQDTMRWFSDQGVELKTEEDGRVFPVSNSSTTIVDCLLQEARRRGVMLQVGKIVSDASCKNDGKFVLKVEKRTIDFVEYVEANYVLIATGSSQQGYKIAVQLGHSLVDPMPSLFTFKIDNKELASLSGVTFSKIRAKLALDNVQRNIPQLTQVGPMLVTHWGLSGPVILRLSAWGARHLFVSSYTGMLFVDFTPDINIEDVKRRLFQHKDQFLKQKAGNSFPSEFGLMKRFWKFLLEHEAINGDNLWASISNNSINSVALLLKQFPFKIMGKGQFKDEFVTAGGVPLSEISLNTMESRIRNNLFFAGEVLNIDGITGGFNFQNAWSGGYIAGTNIGERASYHHLKMEAL
ncbi:hypothetical protein J5N97_011069 [Dioscorea zingiberensis]|uniref:Uncharacterized protein n=1 Tax=Dioscorea zingiberensis TaxID=325984 RepID=A0A9D5D1F0_9LILI|nr:hypothetical protein J5N97_011069 [Dioscorea zingiberensis]